jgi:hypothetical protein
MESPKRRSWDSSKTVLSSQPEEDEPDENTKADEFSQSGQSNNSCLDQQTPAVVERQVTAYRGQEKVKEGSRLVRKLRQFRKGKHFDLVYIQTSCMAFSSDGDIVIVWRKDFRICCITCL